MADEAKETARIEAFSDGMFAIAMTLLVLEIRTPADVPAGGLLKALARQWPAYVAYFISFATIGIMWINHHRLFRLIGKADHGLLVLNALLLLGITFVPFPTALVSTYMLRSDGRVALLVYNGTFFVIAILFNLLWWYCAYRHKLLHLRAEPAAIRSITRRYAVGPLLYAAAFALAFLTVRGSFALNLLLAVFFAIPYGKREEI